MKINSIHRDIALKQGGSGFFSNTGELKGKCSAGMECNYAGYYGSFTGKSKAAVSVLDKILSSSWFGTFSKYADKHNISTSALISLILAGMLRPATIMALPGDKDRDDKIYASGHAMASGIIGFVISTAVTSPFDESIIKVFENKKFQRGKLKEMSAEIERLGKLKEAKTITEEAKKQLKSLMQKKEALNTLVKNIPDWIIAVPRAILTIALIPPILKYVFGMEKKKNKTKQAEQANALQNAQIKSAKQDFIEKDVFKNFKGGLNVYNTSK